MYISADWRCACRWVHSCLYWGDIYLSEVKITMNVYLYLRDRLRMIQSYHISLYSSMSPSTDPFHRSTHNNSHIGHLKHLMNSFSSKQLKFLLFFSGTFHLPSSFTKLTVPRSSESHPIQHQQLQPFLSTLASFVQGPSPNKRDVGVQCLEALLARAECRKAVWDITGIIAG